MAELPMTEVLAAQVRSHRAARGLTRKALAEGAGLSLRFIAEIEAGRANPSLSSLEALARALGEHPFTLLSLGGGTAHTALYRRATALHDAAVGALLAGTGGEKARAGLPVVLLGIRGAGKSTVGRALAEALSRPFVELDGQVEREAGMDLRALFEIHGEAHYRALERACLARALDDRSAPVIAASGGAVTDDETRHLMATRATTVWLKASPESHWERVIAQGDRRPMEGRERAFAELCELLRRREPQYALADLMVETSDKTPAEVVAALHAALTAA